MARQRGRFVSANGQGMLYFGANRNRFARVKISLVRAFSVPLYALFSIVCSTHSVYATERHFAFTYEVATTAKGELELENWVTWQFHGGRNGDPSSSEFDFRHEFEYGITDRLQTSLYFADWHINDHFDSTDHVQYDDAALEIIYRLSSPVTDALGSAIYGEIRGGPQLLELESKVLLQKNFGQWIAAYNAALEARWRGEHLENREGEFSQAAAVSFEISPRFTVGAEALHEIDMPNWNEPEKSIVWMGPNASVRFSHWYVTVTALARLSDNPGEPDVQTRLITGYEF